MGHGLLQYFPRVEDRLAGVVSTDGDGVSWGSDSVGGGGEGRKDHR